MKQILAITRKEIKGYYSSLLAIIFLGSFLAAVLFIFFTVEKFFSRGIADVRPMFQWMPILLIFLLAALTMRQWSEEQRSGTMEILMTLPTRHYQLVIGKFLAVMFMILIALALTLPLPVLVSILGNLDWGPVVGGYLAAILMAAAYAAIGLFVSSRTDNQIVALIVTVLVGGVFYLIGSNGVTGLFSSTTAEILRAVGTGSRFESIQRGVIDLRDLIYYLSLSAFFLMLNVFTIDTIRWSNRQTKYRNNQVRTLALVCLNLILLNVWLFPLQGLRVDLTAQKEFTVSNTTKDLITNLQEPLLIRAYLSENTHPLLAPLIPQIRDMLREYEITSGNMITAEVVDPLSNPEIEAEANQSYGISPTPFQISGRNESSIVNAYFDILVRYGDQSVVLTLNDLISVTQTSTGVDVRLDNLEYDLTSAIKKVVYGFQSIDSILATLNQPAQLTLLVSQNLLPENEADFVTLVDQVARSIAEDSNGKLVYSVVDPDQADAVFTRQQLIDQFGVEPYPVALFSQDTYFFHLLLQNGDQVEIIYPPNELNEADVRTSIEAAIKRTTSGFLKVVGVWTPPSTPTQDMFGQTQQPISSYQMVQQQLSQDYQVENVDLSSGRVSDNIDVLLLIAPQDLTAVQLYAIDQYLMRGGSIVAAVSPFKLDSDPINGFLTLTPVANNAIDLLTQYGVNLSNDLVMDNQNAAFPVVVARNVGGMTVNEIQAVNYPFFVDVRPNKMDTDNPIMANLPTVSMNWSSPLSLDENKTNNKDISVLLQSSDQSWTTQTTNIQPDFETYPELGFAVGETMQSYPLAYALQGSFESYFKDRPIPTTADSQTGSQDITQGEAISGNTIAQSPDNARLVVFGSAAFVDDFPLQLSSRLTQDYYMNNLLLMQNAVDWSVEDLDLLSIRSRGSSTRVLIPLTEQQQTFWEVGLYVFEILLLIAVFVFWQMKRKKVTPLPLLPVSNKKNSEVSND